VRDLIARKLDGGGQDQPPFGLLPLRDLPLLSRRSEGSPRFRLDRKRAEFVDRKERLVGLKPRENRPYAREFFSVVGVVRCEDDALSAICSRQPW
jgi:hypothetical protein